MTEKKLGVLMDHHHLVITEGEECSAVDIETGENDSRGGEEKVVNEKRKKASPKKPPKPPRPPRGPSLDANDIKLITEISQLAMIKRARIQKMKAMKNLKTPNAAASYSSNLCAMLITLIFFLVLLFQGIFSRGSSLVVFNGSSKSAVALSRGLISVKYHNNLSSTGTVGLGS